ASLETFDWNDVTSVSFSSSGGTSAGYRGVGEQFAMDNMTVAFDSPPDTPGPSAPPGLPASDPAGAAVPEPQTWALLLLGVGFLGASRGGSRVGPGASSRA